MHCPCCGYANLDNPLVCGLCGQVFRKVQTAVALPLAAAAPLASALAAPVKGRCESATQGGWALVGIGVLGLGCGLMMYVVAGAAGAADGAPLLQFAASILLVALGVGALSGSRICFKIGFWIYAIDTAIFVLAVVTTGAVLLAGGLLVRVGVLVWLSNQYRSM